MNLSIQINPETKASEVVNSNPLTLLMFEYFSIPLGFNDKTIEELARDHEIDLNLFLSIIRLYNGQNQISHIVANPANARIVVDFLRRSHRNYRMEQFPALTHLLSQISKVNSHDEINLLIQFFDDYLDEVNDHLQYEEEIVFPYITDLQNTSQVSENRFSIAEYRKHHDDIEEKLNDLRNLLIRYLPSQNDMQYRRKFLFALNELETDLHVHGLIEEVILIPIVEKLEDVTK